MIALFLICVGFIIFAIFNYDKWSYRKWYERCVEKGYGYDWRGNFHNHNKK